MAFRDRRCQRLVNTVPKETLVRGGEAEDGGPDGKGLWEPATRTFGPNAETPQNLHYLAGGFIRIDRQG